MTIPLRRSSMTDSIFAVYNIVLIHSVFELSEVFEFRDV